MKNIKTWFESVKNTTLREQLAENLHEDSAGIQVGTLWEAIQLGFNWSQSEEGFEHWSKACIWAYKTKTL